MSDNNSIFVPIGGHQESGHKWSDYTVIYGCVSVGNVPQLAVDLLISTLIELNKCRPVGRLYSPALMPLSGPDAYRFGGQSLTTSAQVFECVDQKLLIIQQRSPVYKELRKEFNDSLTRWLSTAGVKRVIILSSSFIEHLVSALDSGDCYPIKYVANETASARPADIDTTNWSPVERVDPFTLQPSPDGTIHLPASGGLRELLKHLDVKGLPAIGLVLYCSEGDNRPHAYAFIDGLNRWLNLVDLKPSGLKSWIQPFSWRQLFGDEPPNHIY